MNSLLLNLEKFYQHHTLVAENEVICAAKREGLHLEFDQSLDAFIGCLGPERRLVLADQLIVDPRRRFITLTVETTPKAL